MLRRVCAGFTCLILVALPGCAPSADPAEVTDVQLAGSEVLYASGVRSEVETLVNSHRQEGLGGLTTTLVGVMENIDTLQSGNKEGQYQEACNQVLQGIRELNDMVKTSGSPDQVKAKLDDLKKLADSLPSSAVQATPPAGAG